MEEISPEEAAASLSNELAEPKVPPKGKLLFLQALSPEESPAYKSAYKRAFWLTLLTAGFFFNIYVLVGIYYLLSKNKAEFEEGRGYMRGTISAFFACLLVCIGLFLCGLGASFWMDYSTKRAAQAEREVEAKAAAKRAEMWEQEHDQRIERQKEQDAKWRAGMEQLKAEEKKRQETEAQARAEANREQARLDEAERKRREAEQTVEAEALKKKREAEAAAKKLADAKQAEQERLEAKRQAEIEEKRLAAEKAKRQAELDKAAAIKAAPIYHLANGTKIRAMKIQEVPEAGIVRIWDEDGEQHSVIKTDIIQIEQGK